MSSYNCIYICIYNIHTRTHTRTHTHTYARNNTNARMYAHTLTHTFTHAHIYAHTHVYTHTVTHTYTNTPAHTHTHLSSFGFDRLDMWIQKRGDEGCIRMYLYTNVDKILFSCSKIHLSKTCQSTKYIFLRLRKERSDVMSYLQTIFVKMWKSFITTVCMHIRIFVINVHFKSSLD